MADNFAPARAARKAVVAGPLTKVSLSESDDMPPLQTKVQVLSHDSLKDRIITGLSELDRVLPFLEEQWVNGGAWTSSQWSKLVPYMDHLWEDGRAWASGLARRREQLLGPGRGDGAEPFEPVATKTLGAHTAGVGSGPGLALATDSLPAARRELVR